LALGLAFDRTRTAGILHSTTAEQCPDLAICWASYAFQLGFHRSAVELEDQGPETTVRVEARKAVGVLGSSLRYPPSVSRHERRLKRLAGFDHCTYGDIFPVAQLFTVGLGPNPPCHQADACSSDADQFRAAGPPWARPGRSGVTSGENPNGTSLRRPHVRFHERLVFGR
jgi:hypothetical protein